MTTTIEVYESHCVWLSKTKVYNDGQGKTRRRRREYPRCIVGTVFTFSPIAEGRPFMGWTLSQLHSRNPSTKWYGPATAVFDDQKSAEDFAIWFGGMLQWALEYGHPWFGGSRIQVGWDGLHRGNEVTIEGCAVRMYGCGQAAPDTRSFGNLVWVRARGLRFGWRDESMALLDLEGITRCKDGSGAFVAVVHAYPRDYGNDTVYTSEITHVYDPHAKRILGLG